MQQEKLQKISLKPVDSKSKIAEMMNADVAMKNAGQKNKKKLSKVGQIFRVNSRVSFFTLKFSRPERKKTEFFFFNSEENVGERKKGGNLDRKLSSILIVREKDFPDFFCQRGQEILSEQNFLGPFKFV